MSHKTQKFMIIDGNALLHRAWHALPQSMSTKDGTVTNAAYGFTTILLKAFKDIHPTYVAVCFDPPGKTFRDDLFKEYKAHRKKKPQELYDQIPIIQEILKGFGILFYQIKGVEADDVIGTLCRNSNVKTQKSTAQLKTQNLIVTGDLDTLQLVDERTEVYTLRKGVSDVLVYDEQEVKKRFSGLKPAQLIDYKALRGDPSDNIPGAAGIGEKGAFELIAEFQTVEHLLDQLKRHGAEKLAKRTGLKQGLLSKVEESKDNIVLSKKLATIKQNVEINAKLDDFEFKTFDLDAVAAVLKKFEFRSILKTLHALADEYEVASAGAKQQSDAYQFIQTKKQVDEFLRLLEKEKEFAFDTETNSLDTLSAQLIGMSFSWGGGKAYYLDYRTLEETQKQRFKKILEDPSHKKIGHNMKFDWHVLQNYGVNMHGVYFDTMVAAYCLNPGSRAFSLDALTFDYFQKSMQKIEDLIGSKGKQGQLSMGEVDPQKVAYYAAEDADYAWQLYKKLRLELSRRNVDKVFFDIEMPLVTILGSMERNGIALDTKLLHRLHKKVSAKIDELEHRICSLAGEKFNVASPAQLKEILFGKLKIDTSGLKKTKTGISTAASELEKLRGRHVIIEYIFEHRELTKLKSTYIDALPALVDKKTGRIHTSFNQTIAATGRLSSSSPNMQNIPIRTDLGREIRRAFVAAAGYELVSLDYSQIDLRMAAHLSGDTNMIQTFAQGLDIHTITAARLFNKKQDEVSAEERSRAKEANFGVLYGLGPRGLAQRMGVSYEEAVDFIERYKEVYPHVFEYLNKVIERTRKNGYAETFFGRRRYVPDINSHSPVVRAAAERAAINMPVQGTAADVIKIAMINIADKIQNAKSDHLRESLPRPSDEIKMLLQVHDELVFEVKKDKVLKWAPILKKEMEDAATLRVPLRVDAKAGKNWKEMAQVELS